MYACDHDLVIVMICFLVSYKYNCSVFSPTYRRFTDFFGPIMTSKVTLYAHESAEYIQKCIGTAYSTPDAVIVCGSGLGTLASSLRVVREIPYEDIPHFVTSTVAGHQSKLVYALTDELRPIILMVGRLQSVIP